MEYIRKYLKTALTITTAIGFAVGAVTEYLVKFIEAAQ